MSYVVEKQFGRPGSIAYKLQTSTTDADLKWMDELTTKWLAKGVQILVVGSFTIYAEYEPVTYVNSREEFEEHIKRWLI